MEKLYQEGRIVQTKLRTVPSYKRYLDEMPGVATGDVWTDLRPVQGMAQEFLGYPTQKPVALLERIIQASSNVGDVVLDPFAGCGTTIAAAQKLKRRWIGMDVTQLSIALLKNRLADNFGLKAEKPGKGGGEFLEGDPNDYIFEVIGEPEDLHDARVLANDENQRYQFQYWALSQIQARPLGGVLDGRYGKKGADKGIDGIKVFIDDNSGKAKRIIVSVKSGHVSVAQLRDLVGTVEREGAAMGVFLTLENPTKPMIDEAASAGFFHSDGWHKDYPKIQILTVEQLLAGKQIEMPPSGVTFKQAERIETETKDQGTLGFD